MKPTSIVFLVIAALLIVGGIITCSIAKDIAETDGYALFHDTENGGSYVRHDFKSADVSKIELVVTDAEINIKGGTEESYIEFFNFRDGLYTFSTSGKVISLDELPNLKSILSFNSGFSFSGMRYILRAGTTNLGPKVVNIYIGPESSLKVISVTADNCTLNADKISTQFDLNITASASSHLRFSEYRTGCALVVDAPEINFSLQNGYVNRLSLSAPKTVVDVREIIFNNLNIEA